MIFFFYLHKCAYLTPAPDSADELQTTQGKYNQDFGPEFLLLPPETTANYAALFELTHPQSYC